MSLIAVTGGTGFVGGHLLSLAVEAGHSVRALTRRDQPPASGVEWISGTLSDQQSLNELARGADIFIHIAGAINAPDRAGFADANIAGTENAINAAKAAGISRFIHISSLAGREPDISDYGWSKAQSEVVVRNSGLDWTIIRPPTVYGPGDRETLELFKMAARGLAVLPPAGRTSLIHVADLVRLMLDSASAQAASGALYEPDDGTANGLSHVEFAHALGHALGKKVRTIAMPPALVRIGSRLDRLFRGDNAKLTPDRARYFCHPHWVVNPVHAPPASLWSPSIPYEQGLRDTAIWYRNAEWLS